MAKNIVQKTELGWCRD